MDAGRDQILKEKREERSKLVLITFPNTKNNDYQNFNVVDEEGTFKYDGFVQGPEPSKEDYCSCKSFENGNNSKINGFYPDTHGFSFQCKHIIAARDEARKVQEQLKIFSPDDAIAIDDIDKLSIADQNLILEAMSTENKIEFQKKCDDACLNDKSHVESLGQ